jgi:hypothetical protein
MYGSSSDPFTLQVGVTPKRKLLEVMGRVNPAFSSLSAPTALTQLAATNEKTSMKEMSLYFTGTTSPDLAELFAFDIRVFLTRLE